ncbi:hypothetical protein [Oceanibium sediminis]|uniref:hypothetical protein n=1 Tax=Oceanibium sediminis TaxID=2026339 RepID=UPI000DD2CB1F|nr:hypothetical protein [Oceanibium sediminis]
MIVRRLAAGFIRALAVVLVIGTPALLLPNVSVASQEISLIVAGLAAAFTVFEYASTHPGLIDFRFAPPYNRVRFISFALLILALTFLARGFSGSDDFSLNMLMWGERALELARFPLSPVVALSVALPDNMLPLNRALVEQSAALSFWLAVVLMILFGGLLWLMRWPVARRDFNLWLNLPTFAPGYARDVERRLLRDGVANILVGAVILYLSPTVAMQLSGIAQPSDTPNYELILWSTALWGFVPGSLAIRGIAILKIARLVRAARL